MGLLGLGFIQKHISVVVIYDGIELWLHIFAAVCNSRICGCQFQIADAVCQTAEAETEVFILLAERGKTEVLRILITKIDADFFQCLYSHDIDGIGNCIPDGCVARVFVVIIFVCLCPYGIRGIVLNRCQRQAAGVQSGRVAGNDLEG